MGIQQATLERAILEMPQLAPAIALLKVGTKLGAIRCNSLHTLCPMATWPCLSTSR